MRLWDRREMHHSGTVRVHGTHHHAIHARAYHPGCRLHPVGGILSGFHPLLGDDHGARHEAVDRLRNHHHGRGERGGDQNGSSWDRWL